MNWPVWTYDVPWHMVGGCVVGGLIGLGFMTVPTVTTMIVVFGAGVFVTGIVAAIVDAQRRGHEKRRRRAAILAIRLLEQAMDEVGTPPALKSIVRSTYLEGE